MANNYISLKCCQVTNFKKLNNSAAGKAYSTIQLSFRRLGKLSFLLSFIFSFLITQEIIAQASTYVFSQSNGTYTPITGGTILVTSINNVPSIDNFVSPYLTIPFNFAGTAQPGMQITANGQVSLGGSPPSSTTYNVLSTTTGGNVFLAPFSANLNSSPTSTSEIRYQTISNEFIVQWTNFQRSGVTENISFQVRMNTSTGVIKFIYDGTPPYGSSTSYQPQIGIKSATGNYSALTVASGGSWNSPIKITTGITASSICTFTSNTGPTSGLTYTWSPDVPGIPNCATSFAPANSSMGVAISPTLSWASGGGVPTSYDVYFGTNSTNPAFIGNQIETSYNPSPLAANTNYYWKVVPKNSFGTANACAINTFKTGAAPSYCTPVTLYGDYIKSFITTLGISNINNPSGGQSSAGYGNFYPSHSASQYQGGTLNFTEIYTGGGHGFSIWVDFNNDGLFSTAERLYNAASVQSGFTGTITIPLSAAAGDYRMRIRAWYAGLNPDPCTSINYGEAEDYKLTVLSLTPCTGTPTAGVVTVNPASGSPGSLYSVTASGFTTGTGQTFQWQYSDTGGPTWTNQGAATPSYNNLTGLTAPAFGIVRTWRLVVTCIASAQSANSLTGTFTSSYCTPSSTSNSTYINNFSTTGGATNIFNLNSGYTSGGYQNNFASQAVTVLPSDIFAFNFTVVGGSLGAAIWIDWDNDGVFNNPAERVFVTASYGNGPYSGPITVPSGIAAGNYRMRVMVDYNVSMPSNPCMTVSTRTETEDYKITVGVLAPCSGTPTAGAVTVNPVSGQPGTTYAVNASGFTGASGLTFQWQYSDTGGPTWTNQGGVTTSYNNLTGMIAPAFGIVRTWRLVVTCTASGIAANSLTGTFTSAYCVPTNTYSTSYYITNVTSIGGLSNFNNSSTGFSAYTDFSSIFVSQYANSSFSLSASHPSSTYGYTVWIDWNNNGDFSDSGEMVISTGYLPTPASLGTITIPPTQAPGNYRMRIRNAYLGNPPPACGAFNYGEAEDYTLKVLSYLPCVAPTAQPTALTLNVNAAVINGSFTAAVPAPNSYLVLAGTSATPPTIANGTVYPIGSTIGANYIVVDNDSNTTFSANSLNSATTYYFFVYSMNNFCTGGPLYLQTAPLTGSATTGTCVPVVSSGYQDDVYITKVDFLGTLNDVSNTSTYSGSPLGYQDWTSRPKSIQARGEYVNVSLQNNLTSHIIAWVDWDKDGNFSVAEKVYDTNDTGTSAGTFNFLIPSSQALGDYRIRIRINGFYLGYTYPYTACQILTNESGETEDYLFTVVEKCNTLITTVTDGVGCNVNNLVVLGATATAGVTQFKWYSAITGGSLLGTTTSGTWTTPSITTTTNYYVTATNGTCESQIRTLVIARVNKAANITFTPVAPKICGDTEVLQITASVPAGTKEFTYLLKEDFESGGLGGFTTTALVDNGTTVNNQTNWQNQTSTHITGGDIWVPAIASGPSANKFVMSTSDVGDYIVHTELVSPVFSTFGFASLNLLLKFDIYYSRYYKDGQSEDLDYLMIEGSRDGGVTWLNATQLNITADKGNPGKFLRIEFPIGFISNEPLARFRIRYYAEWCDGVAIDNIEVSGYGPVNIKFDTATAAAFTDAAATIPYISGTPATSIYVKPTLTQLENGVLSIPVTTNSNLCGPSVAITNNTKSFTAGTASTDWNTAANWKPAGVPTASNCVIILDDNVEVNGTNFSALGFDLSIKEAAKLTVKPSNNIFLTDKVNISLNGELILNNSGSLIQTNDVPNTGAGPMKMERAANIRKFDYVYWSSPVTTASAFSTTSISPLTNSSLIYKWIPTISGNTNGFGNWTSGIENMISGKGYIVRGPDSFSNTPAAFTATFAGTPSNGTINIPILRGIYNGPDYLTPASTTLVTKEDDNWNLVGNPYPSAIKAIDFLTANTSIDGFINIWTHGSMPNSTIANPFYGTFGYNYNLSDYITYNSSGASTGPGTFNGYIPAGQGFFVAMLHTSTTPGNLTFTNLLRGSANNNSVFYRSAAEQSSAGEGRIWLDIIAEDGSNVRNLVAYVEGATNDRDRLYDAITDNKENLNLFSNIGDEIMKIQGRQAPLNQTDMVSMGIKVPTNGLYNIAIAAVDGLFEDSAQNIYLEDKNTAIIHNLRESPYSFSAEVGIDAERFILRYSNQTLGNTDFENDSPKVLIASSNQIEIKSTVSEIKSVRVFDVAGRQLAYYSDVNSYDFALSTFRKLNSTLIIQVTLANDLVVNKKIIF